MSFFCYVGFALASKSDVSSTDGALDEAALWVVVAVLGYPCLVLLTLALYQFFVEDGMRMSGFVKRCLSGSAVFMTIIVGLLLAMGRYPIGFSILACCAVAGYTAAIMAKYRYVLVSTMDVSHLS